MSCKPKLYIANTTSTPVTADSIVPFTVTVRRRGLDIERANGGAIIEDTGSNYYDVFVNATFTAPVAGTVTLKLQHNGIDVVGATASTTITTATTEIRSLAFSATIRTFNNVGIDTITLVNSGVAITTSNVTMIIDKE